MLVIRQETEISLDGSDMEKSAVMVTVGTRFLTWEADGGNVAIIAMSQRQWRWAAASGPASVGQGESVDLTKIVQGRDVERSRAKTSERKGLIRLAEDIGHAHCSGQSCHPRCM